MGAGASSALAEAVGAVIAFCGGACGYRRGFNGRLYFVALGIGVKFVFLFGGVLLYLFFLKSGLQEWVGVSGLCCTIEQQKSGYQNYISHGFLFFIDPEIIGKTLLKQRYVAPIHELGLHYVK